MVVLLFIAGNRGPTVTGACPMVGSVTPQLVLGRASRIEALRDPSVRTRWCYQREPRAGLREMPSRRLRDSAAAGGGEHVPPSPGETLDEGLAEPDAEDLRRVDPAVDAGDDVQVQVRDEREPGPALARADA